MTFCSHLKEIARQGIWASLTGGWYYEPTYTIFCNTVHLYIWLLLFLFPLILGRSYYILKKSMGIFFAVIFSWKIFRYEEGWRESKCFFFLQKFLLILHYTHYFFKITIVFYKKGRIEDTEFD